MTKGCCTFYGQAGPGAVWREDRPRIRIFDYGPETFDRYMVVFLDQPQGNGAFAALAMSEDPKHPQGVCLHVEARLDAQLGHEIDIEALPRQCREVLAEERV